MDAQYTDAFVDLLALAAETKSVRVVVTMRLDFYHRCLDWPVLNTLIANGNYALMAPNVGALYEMINRPAERAGLRFEDGLADISWCEVPGGDISLEKDAGTFRVEPFFIAKYPGTWIQYRAFLDVDDGYRNRRWWEKLAQTKDKNRVLRGGSWGNFKNLARVVSRAYNSPVNQDGYMGFRVRCASPIL